MRKKELSCRAIIKGLPLYNQTFRLCSGRQKNTRELRFLDQTQLTGSFRQNPNSMNRPHSLGDIVSPSNHTMSSGAERGWEEQLQVSLFRKPVPFSFEPCVVSHLIPNLLLSSQVGTATAPRLNPVDCRNWASRCHQSGTPPG